MKRLILLWTVVNAIIFNIKSIANLSDTKPDLAQNYAIATAALIKLWNLEENFIKNLTEHVNFGQQQNSKFSLLQDVVRSLQMEHKRSVNNSETYLSNPLNAFTLIRRMHSDWYKWQAYMWKHDYQPIFNLTSIHRHLMPNDIDLEQAIAGILRIRETYDIEVNDMADGFLGGLQYDTQLSPLDCFAIGNYLQIKLRHVQAKDWFQAALQRYKSPKNQMYDILGLKLGDIWFSLALVLDKNEEYEESFEAASKALTLDPLNTTIQGFQGRMNQFLIHEELCRKGSKLNTRLHCRYNSSTTAYLKLAPLKMEEVAMDPYMVIYHDVVYESEILEIKRDAAPLFKRGEVGKGGVTSERTSNTAHFTENCSPLMKRIHQRFVDMTGLNFSSAQPLQIVNYGLAGHYYNHVDYHNVTKNPDLCEESGDRLAAVLLYLSDVEDGGSTVFVNIKTAIPPEKGSALVWYNLDSTGSGNLKAMHASCPVIVGSKWVGIKLAFQRPQMLITPSNDK